MPSEWRSMNGCWKWTFEPVAGEAGERLHNRAIRIFRGSFEKIGRDDVDLVRRHRTATYSNFGWKAMPRLAEGSREWWSRSGRRRICRRALDRSPQGLKSARTPPRPKDSRDRRIRLRLRRARCDRAGTSSPVSVLYMRSRGREIHERARDDRLILRAHREIRIVPAAEDAQPLEILALQIDHFSAYLRQTPRICAAVILAFFAPSS